MPDPTRIGRYVVRRPLGSGAFAVVWLGHDEVLDAPVAIKVLADNWAHNADLRSRFIDEAKVLRRADSDRVVRVFDIGELDDGRPYFVMSYADRGSLADRLTSGPLPVDTALRLGTAIARGVDVLHDIGVLHRDVKPSNVLFHSASDGERVLIGDLGLAKELADASGFTVTAGTPGYMAPEQGEYGGGLDKRTDVYGIGATVYRAVTGQVPGYGGSPVVSPRELRPELPQQAEQTIMRALHPDPDQRWPDAAAFGAALAEAAPERPRRRPRARRPRPRWPWLAAAALLLSTGGAGMWLALKEPDKPVYTATIIDDTGRISFDVPASWAGQRQGAGWYTTDIGLPAEPRAAGVAVAPDLAGWRDRGSPTPGVFVGVSRNPQTKEKVQAITHPHCQRGKPLSRGDATWTIWRCAGIDYAEGMKIVDSDLTAYVQVKQLAGEDHTELIMRTLTIR